MKRVCAIFDIGKTNKKFFLFDEDYEIVYESSVNFDEINDEDGFLCDDIVSMAQWVRENLREKLSDRAFDIVALNFSTYGASFVHINREGKLLTPLYNYLKPFPEDLANRFYETYGDSDKVSVETSSPALGMLNSGLQLYWLKHTKPDVFGKIDSSLHLPQYLAYLFHGKCLSDMTSIGCHTALWDFNQHDYHSWVRAEKIDNNLAPLFSSEDVLETEVNDKPLLCGVGLHDSSAAFIPYILTVHDPFVLISTGTWCITMNPYNQTPLTADELAQDCLCYMTYKGKPVKASRLFAGYDHEQETKKMASHFDVGVKYFANVKYDPQLVARGENTTSVFDCKNYTTYEEAYHHLIASLIRQQKKSTDLVMSDEVEKIFVDGGFAKNEIYMNLLSAAYPGHEVYAASVSQATALGAALAIHDKWNKKPVKSNLITKKLYA